MTAAPHPEQMTQIAPYPEALAEMVRDCTYRPGWQVYLADVLRDPPSTHAGEGRGLTLVIVTNTINSYPPHQPMRVHHYFIVPAATYNRQAWLRWLFEQFAKVELHECMEFFTVGGDKPFAPNHGPGCDPYTVTQLATDEERRTSFRGELNPPTTPPALGRCRHCGLTNEACENTDPDGICCAQCSHEVVRERQPIDPPRPAGHHPVA